MPDIAQFNEILEQLPNLSLEQLKEVRAKVNMLIEIQSLGVKPNLGQETLQMTYKESKQPTFTTEGLDEILKQSSAPIVLYPTYSTITATTLRVFLRKVGAIKNNTTIYTTKKISSEDESLSDVIHLVSEWLGDESGYDEETYPQIEAALNGYHYND